MGYSLAFTSHNYKFEPKGELEEEQEQEVFFWNVKNTKISLIRVNARLPVLKQLQKGQCPQIRTALCVWPQVEGYDFLIPEERTEFFVKWGRVMKYLQSGKAMVGPKIVRFAPPLYPNLTLYPGGPSREGQTRQGSRRRGCLARCSPPYFPPSWCTNDTRIGQCSYSRSTTITGGTGNYRIIWEM